MKSINMNKNDLKNNYELNNQNFPLSNNMNYIIDYEKNINSIPPQYRIFQKNIYTILNFTNFQSQKNCILKNVYQQINTKEKKKQTLNKKPKKK